MAVAAALRSVRGFPDYAVSEDGHVYKGDRLLAMRPDKDGYRCVWFYVDGREIRKYVHQLVADAWLDAKPTPKHEVRHLDGVNTNNVSTNLAWGTHRENMADRSRHGRTPTFRGETNGRAKLSADDVTKIRERLNRGDVQRAIAADYNVSRSTIRDINTRACW